MPLFDVHIHVYPRGMVTPVVAEMIEGRLPEAVMRAIESPDALLRFLDEHGVDRACCISEVSPDVMGFTREVNDWIARFTSGHRDRLIATGSVNPLHEPDCRAEIARVLDLGIGLIKIHPPHQLFRPNAYRDTLPQLAEIYRACAERNVPVMFHTGTSVFPNARNVFADPMPVDDVAVDFPTLRIILAHAGRPLYGDTAFFLARRHANVFVDISGIPPRSLPTAFPRLAEISNKVLWGTDWPSPGVTSPKKNVEEFRTLGFDDAIERRVLWENAVSIFGSSTTASS